MNEASKIYNYSNNYQSDRSLGALEDELFVGDVANGLNVTATGNPGLSVNLNPGAALIRSGQRFAYKVQVTEVQNISLSPASASNPRVDTIIGYVDLEIEGSGDIEFIDGTNGIVKYVSVSGTPAVSPSQPSESAILAEIGAGNPYIRLGNVNVPAGASSILASNIVDIRDLASVRNFPSNMPDDYVKSQNVDWATLPAFAARPTGAQSNISGNKINFGDERFDSTDSYDPTESVFTAPVAGLYHFDATVAMVGLSSQGAWLTLIINGGTGDNRFARINTSGAVSINGSLNVLLSEGDEVSLRIDIAGTNRNTESTFSFFGGYLINKQD